MEEGANDYHTDDDDIVSGIGIPRGGGRGRIQENPMYGRNWGNDEFIERNLGSIKHKIPNFQDKTDPMAYLQ